MEYKPELDIAFDEKIWRTILSFLALRERCWKDDFLMLISASLFHFGGQASEQAELTWPQLERRSWAFGSAFCFLHINGYDHYTPEEEAEMLALQEEF